MGLQCGHCCGPPRASASLAEHLDGAAATPPIQSVHPKRADVVSCPVCAQIEEVKRVLRLMPIFFTMIMFWAVYAQMSSLFVVQGEQMDRRARMQGQARDCMRWLTPSVAC